MNRIASVWSLVLLSAIVPGVSLSAQSPNFAMNRRLPHGARKPGVSEPVAPLFRGSWATHLPSSATRDAIQATCPVSAQNLGAVCGYVNVPLDREHPESGSIAIYFELYLHSASGPAVSAILANLGGPGTTTTGFRYTFYGVFGPALDVHDLLLIDDRGRGLSGTIDCIALQFGTAAFDPATADCAAQLSNANRSYGTGDIAQDTDAVRAALGYDQVDYYGGSYGGEDVTAYATRFANHLRSIVLDAPAGTPILDQSRFPLERYRTHAELDMLRNACSRSLSCASDHPAPGPELDALVSAIRKKPLVGDAYDANGNLLHVRMDETYLLNYVIDEPTGNFVSTGEVLAAARSYRQGDSVPLLRLGAEGFFLFDFANYGSSKVFSYGAELATACVDMREPWDWSDPISERLKKYREALRDLPPDYFAPFSAKAAGETYLAFSAGTVSTGKRAGTHRRSFARMPFFRPRPRCSSLAIRTAVSQSRR